MSIATEIQRLQTAKADIKTAIEEKGVEVGDGTIDTFASKISEITGGGGSGVPTGYKTVTFMNDDEFLFERLVLSGDDCPDPVTQGRIETPTKESTVDTVYTYSGWSLTNGGDADTNALKNVTENRTVYVAYTEDVRYYTVRFFDGDTLLKTEQVTYGGSSNYTYEKEGHMFNGWNPEPTNITRTMDCYGSWEQVYSFADASWEYIAQMSESGMAAKVFKIGDTRNETITFRGQQFILKFAIADFNYDYLSDGSGNTAGISIVQSVVNSNCKHNGTCNTSNPDWTTLMKPDFDTAYESGIASSLKSVIKQVQKKAWNSSKNMTTADCYLWPLSVGELFTENPSTICTLDERAQNRPYSLFVTNPESIKGGLRESRYGLRSRTGKYDYACVTYLGNIDVWGGEQPTRMGFCI